MATRKDVKGKKNNKQRNWMKKRVGANFIREKVATRVKQLVILHRWSLFFFFFFSQYTGMRSLEQYSHFQSFLL